MTRFAPPFRIPGEPETRGQNSFGPVVHSDAAAGPVPTAGRNSKDALVSTRSRSWLPCRSTQGRPTMKKRFACRCLLCQLESNLRKKLEEPQRQQEYSTIAGFSPLLAPFPSIAALTAHLRSCRSVGNGCHPADGILSELLHSFQIDGTHSLLRDVLLLLFIPSLHSTSRQVARRYPLLPTDDTAQHLLACLLEVLGSGELRNRNSHLAFAISRTLKRSVFDWAERETRPLVPIDGHERFSESAVPWDGTEPVERAVLLRHFLFRCQREGLLTGSDVELLVHIKLEGNFGGKQGNTAYSNALRQKIKRLLQKLRHAAQQDATP